MDEFLFKRPLSVLLDLYLGVDLLGHVVTLCLTCRVNGPWAHFSTASALSLKVPIAEPSGQP